MINAIVPHPPKAPARCADCGGPGNTYADDHTTLLCARCWIARHTAKR